MLIQIDRSTSVPIYRQIEERIRKLIIDGSIRPGTRIPSTRQLAEHLGVNRITVGAAFAKLEAEGLITSHVGRGTFVSWRGAAREEQVPSMAVPNQEIVSRMWNSLFSDLPAPLVPPMTVNPRQSRTSCTIAYQPSVACC